MISPELRFALKAISDDLIVLPGGEAYDEITKSYFSELERELKPACYLTPRSADTVSELVKVLGKQGILRLQQAATASKLPRGRHCQRLNHHPFARATRSDDRPR